MCVCVRARVCTCACVCSHPGIHHHIPPQPLLLPGRLSERPYLSSLAVCYLFYAETFWSRATGGAKGASFSRMRAGVDNKEMLAVAFTEYFKKHKCEGPPRGYPRTMTLNNAATCEAFFHENARFAPRHDSLWFVKANNGSLGSHIRLLRSADVTRMAANGSYSCPMPGRIASLEVPNMWTPSKRKFDRRYYLLIPSLDPLIILAHPGYLRFSAVEYSRAQVCEWVVVAVGS